MEDWLIVVIVVSSFVVVLVPISYLFHRYDNYLIFLYCTLRTFVFDLNFQLYQVFVDLSKAFHHHRLIIEAVDEIFQRLQAANIYIFFLLLLSKIRSFF